MYYDVQYDQYDDIPISIVLKQQAIINTQPSNVNDKILKRLEDMEIRVKYHGKAKLLYTSICIEPIHPSVPTKTLQV